MFKPTGWQPHGVRAFFSGPRQKGWVLEREARKDGTWGYRLVRNEMLPAAVAGASTESARDESTPMTNEYLDETL